MKPDPLNSFLDFNGDGEIDPTEEFLGFLMMTDALGGEDDDADGGD